MKKMYEVMIETNKTNGGMESTHCVYDNEKAAELAIPGAISAYMEQHPDCAILNAEVVETYIDTDDSTIIDRWDDGDDAEFILFADGHVERHEKEVYEVWIEHDTFYTQYWEQITRDGKKLFTKQEAEEWADWIEGGEGISNTMIQHI